jgi:parvulin-like peptidyl-prolyl isomerase
VEGRLAERAALLLALGACTGIAVAALGVLGGRRAGTGDPDSVARVNGAAIAARELDQALERLAAERRRPVGAEDRAHVLDRLIEEELLVQRGVELGLVRSDRAVRAALVSSLIGAVVADAASAPPDETELRRFYARNAGYFARPARLRVQQIFFRAGPDALPRARAARVRLEAGESADSVRETLGDAELSGLPDAPLPPAKLRDHLGPALARAAESLAPGEWSRPLESADGVHLLGLVSAEPDVPPPFESVRAQVESELRRREGDRALRAYLDELRSAADIALAPDPAQ